MTTSIQHLVVYKSQIGEDNIGYFLNNLSNYLFNNNNQRFMAENIYRYFSEGIMFWFAFGAAVLLFTSFIYSMKQEKINPTIYNLSKASSIFCFLILMLIVNASIFGKLTNESVFLSFLVIVPKFLSFILGLHINHNIKYPSQFSKFVFSLTNFLSIKESKFKNKFLEIKSEYDAFIFYHFVIIGTRIMIFLIARTVIHMFNPEIGYEKLSIFGVSILMMATLILFLHTLIKDEDIKRIGDTPFVLE